MNTYNCMIDCRLRFCWFWSKFLYLIHTITRIYISAHMISHHDIISYPYGYPTNHLAIVNLFWLILTLRSLWYHLLMLLLEGHPPYLLITIYLHMNNSICYIFSDLIFYLMNFQNNSFRWLYRYPPISSVIFFPLGEFFFELYIYNTFMQK